MKTCTYLVCLGLLALPVTGCGPSGPETYPVSGTVTWNGDPLPEGDIVFSPVDGSLAPDAGKIVAGKFEFQAQPGEKRVEIDATRESGEVDPVMHMAPRQAYIPSKYNSETTLKATVTAGGDNTFIFDLTEEGAE
ncbi:MAG TPA: hypothetical protein VNA25_07060 [Phycisphaerae bacterium]|nr:hypothetical protein [Phycisphaerae bacterium]